MKAQSKSATRDSRIENLNKTLSFLGNVNRAIARSRGLVELFQAICDAAVAEDAFKMCWIALADPLTHDLNPVVAAGHPAHRWPFSIVNTKTGPLKNGLAATAIRTRSVQTSSGSRSSKTSPNLDVAEYKFRASAAIPFVSKKNTSGIVCLFSDRDDFFNSAALKDVLTHLSSDLSYAVDTQEVVDEKLRSEKTLALQTSTLQTIYDVSAALSLAGEDLESTVSHIITLISERMFSNCSIWLNNENDPNTLNLAGYRTWKSTTPTQSGQLEDSSGDVDIHATIAKTRKDIFFPIVDVESVREVLGVDAAKSVEERGIHSLILVQLVAQGVPIGALALSRGSENGTSFTKFDYQVARSVAGRAALSVLNAELLDQLRSELSQRIETEVALKESEARLRLFVEHAPAALAMFDKDMRYLAASKRWLWDHGLSGRDIIGRSQFELFTDISEEWKRNYRKGLSGEVVRKTDDAQARSDGAKIWTSWEIRPWYSRDLVVGGILIFSEDTSQRVLSSRKIEQQLSRLRALQTVEHTISATSDFELVTNVLLSQAIQQLNVDAATILLRDPGQVNLRFAAGKGFRTSLIGETKIPIGRSFAGKAARERATVVAPRFDLSAVEPSFRALAVAEEFGSVFAVPLIAKDDIKGVLEVFLRTQFSPDDDWIEFLETIGKQAAVAIDNTQLFESLHLANENIRKGYDATIEGWSMAMDLRDRETEGHSKRVTELTDQMAEIAGIGEMERIHIRRGAMLHDIGKLGIPDSILHKPAALSPDEMAIMQKHPVYAYEMLVSIEYLKPAIDIPYCHHEKWDGSGYPRGLVGDQIPRAARLFSVVDVWDALTHDRPYRNAITKTEAIAYIIDRSGKDFDPAAVEIFLRLIRV